MSSRAAEVRPTVRWGSPRARRTTDVTLAVFSVLMVAAMIASPGEETVPYHLLFLSVTIVYGFRVWPIVPTTIAVAGVTVATGAVLYVHYRQDYIDRPELTEVVLMPALLMAMVWHARRRLEAQDAMQAMALQQDAMIQRERDFFRDTAHAIRTPVTIARGHLEWVAEGAVDPRVHDDVQVALRQLRRMGVLSTRLQAIAQLDAGSSMPVELVSWREFSEDLSVSWSGHGGRRWVFEHPEQDAHVLVVPDLLALALDAVIENAVHFTAADGTITVSARVSRTHCSIRVADDGPGIDPADVHRVFDRFWYRRPPDGQMGTGLGLAMTAATARAYGGTVTAGNAPDGGAVFELALPTAQPAALPTAQPGAVPAADVQTTSA